MDTEKQNNAGKPIKRHVSLVPLSRDHHHTLLLCWKIKTGITRGISTHRIKEYASYFYTGFIMPHFTIEERYIFPLAGESHPMVEQALKEHALIRELFRTISDDADHLTKIAMAIEKHVRFEERELFPEIEKIAGQEKLLSLELQHDRVHEEKWRDQFWLK
mgnify:FL=1